MHKIIIFLVFAMVSSCLARKAKLKGLDSETLNLLNETILNVCMKRNSAEVVSSECNDLLISSSEFELNHPGLFNKLGPLSYPKIPGSFDFLKEYSDDVEMLENTIKTTPKRMEESDDEGGVLPVIEFEELEIHRKLRGGQHNDGVYVATYKNKHVVVKLIKNTEVMDLAREIFFVVLLQRKRWGPKFIGISKVNTASLNKKNWGNTRRIALITQYVSASPGVQNADLTYLSRLGRFCINGKDLQTLPGSIEPSPNFGSYVIDPANFEVDCGKCDLEAKACMNKLFSFPEITPSSAEERRKGGFLKRGMKPQLPIFKKKKIRPKKVPFGEGE